MPKMGVSPCRHAVAKKASVVQTSVATSKTERAGVLNSRRGGSLQPVPAAAAGA